MRSIIYLLATTFKNFILELRRKPGKLIFYLLLIVLIIGTGVGSSLSGSSAEPPSLELFYLKAIIFAYCMIFLVMAIMKGTSSGDTFFDMSDVNLLFVSPVSPKAILIYGLIKMTKIAFLAGFFILFQAVTLNNVFGVPYVGVVIILLAFMLSLVLTEIIALLIYSFSNGNARRKLIVRILAVLFVVPAVAYFIWLLVQSGDILLALERLVSSPVFDWIPAAGWATHGAIALIHGQFATAAIFLGLIVVVSILLTLFIMSARLDYYEDVLVATETEFEKKRALSEGKLQDATMSSRKVKVNKTGIRGKGAQALFYKHLREAFRSSRWGIFDKFSLIMIAGSILLAFIMRGESSLIILQILMWMQIFFIGNTGGLKELSQHYIYLIPASSFSKIVWSNLTSVLRIAVESVVMFGAAGIILNESIALIAMSILVYVLFSFMLIAINYLSLRWTQTTISQGLLIMIYTLAVIIALAPGLVAAIVVGLMIGGTPGLLVGLGILAAWELIVAVIGFTASRGILDRCDMQSINTVG